MTTTTISAKLTLEQFLELPETKPASEYINGEKLLKPMPQGEHSLLQSKLCSRINQVTENPKIAYAFPELRCTFAGASIVPDVAVFLWERIPRQASGRIQNRFDTYPDWTIEILSPDQSQMRVTRNILHCLNNGTELGWLIDPNEELVLVFAPGEQPQLFDRPQDILPLPECLSHLHSDLQLSVRDLFGWLSL